MSIIAAALKHMLAAGMDHDAIVEAVADMEANAPKDATAERRRQADKERKRLRKSAESAEGADASPSPKKEMSPAPLKEKTTPSQSETNVSSKTPRAALETVLDAARAGDVIEMRQRIRKPLTRRAAELLAGQLSQWHDPNEAADAMVLNAWQGFKPEYLHNQRARGSPAFSRPAKPDHFANFEQELIDGQDRDDRSDRSNRDDAQGVPILTIDYHRG